VAATVLKNSVRALCATAALSLAPAANAAINIYTASLSGPNESPANNSPGTGSAIVTIDTTANTMRVQVNFSGLTSGTIASHIHAATAVPLTGTAGVATTLPTFPNFPLGVTSGTYDSTFDLLTAGSYNPAFVSANGGTPASAEAALLAAIGAGRAYLNVHTTNFTGGEIRGFLTAVPEPASWMMMLIGFGALGMVIRRRKGSLGGLEPARL